MHYPSLETFLRNTPANLKTGPVGMIFVEDDVEVDNTIRYHLAKGANPLLVFVPDSIAISEDLSGQFYRISYDLPGGARFEDAINAILAILPRNVWLFYCFNAEYLFYPFCEHRTIGEMLAFHSEERRRGMLTYVIDAYAEDLSRSPDGVSLETAHIDRYGYYALVREDPTAQQPRERQLDFFGGIRWRFEEYIPAEQQRIDRISLFRSEEGLRINHDHTLNIQEYNTYSCPWHHNLTAAMISFRTAKGLLKNPKSRQVVHSYMWYNSCKFNWSSAQLMEFGLMEPGQWF